MNAAVETPAVAAVKPSGVWKWVLGVVVLLLAGFLYLGRHVTNEYEGAVARKLGTTPAAVSFTDVQRYPSGVVCGLADGKPFIVGVQGDVVMDDGTSVGTAVFGMTRTKVCAAR